jgi:hypothetical protein
MHSGQPQGTMRFSEHDNDTVRTESPHFPFGLTTLKRFFSFVFTLGPVVYVLLVSQ